MKTTVEEEVKKNVKNKLFHLTLINGQQLFGWALNETQTGCAFDPKI